MTKVELEAVLVERDAAIARLSEELEELRAVEAAAAPAGPDGGASDEAPVEGGEALVRAAGTPVQAVKAGLTALLAWHGIEDPEGEAGRTLTRLVELARQGDALPETTVRALRALE